MGMLLRRYYDLGEAADTSPKQDPLENEEKKYTKSEIMRMSLEELKKLAEENGLDSAMSGAKIKTELVNKFNL